MARGLVDQAVQAKAVRISDSNKRKQEAAKAYVAAPTNGKVYVGNLPLCNKCKLHHNGQCNVKCKNYQKVGHLTKDCKIKTPATKSNTQQTVTSFGCGDKGHYKNKYPKRKEQQNK
ncbi:hypothetical protein Tco_0220628, partial [Tanacetum coccineum]